MSSGGSGSSWRFTESLQAAVAAVLNTSAPITWIATPITGYLCRREGAGDLRWCRRRRAQCRRSRGGCNAGADDAWHFTLGESQDAKMFGSCSDR